VRSTLPARACARSIGRTVLARGMVEGLVQTAEGTFRVAPPASSRFGADVCFMKKEAIEWFLSAMVASPREGETPQLPATGTHRVSVCSQAQ